MSRYDDEDTSAGAGTAVNNGDTMDTNGAGVGAVDDAECDECEDDGCGCARKPFISFSTGSKRNQNTPGGKGKRSARGSSASGEASGFQDARDSQLAAAASMPELTEHELMKLFKKSSRPHAVSRKFSMDSLRPPDAGTGDWWSLVRLCASRH